MRKKIALCGVAIVFALVASTLALPAPRHATAGADQAVRLGPPAHQARGSITIHRLLRSRLEWTLRVTRALRLLEQPSPPTSLPGMLTIIDEPDPTGRSDNPDERTAPMPHPIERDPEPDHPEGANGIDEELRDFG